MANFFELFGKALFPEGLRKGVAENSLKAGIEKPIYKTVGIVFIFGFILMIFIDLYVYYNYDVVEILDITNVYLKIFATPIFILIISLVFLAIYFFVVLLIIEVMFDYLAFKRTKDIESKLPGFLKSISENLKGGTTFEQALLESIKPDFGELSKEMVLVAKRISIGESTERALLSFAEKFDSLEIKRTISIMSETLYSGSEIIPLLDKMSNELEETLQMKEEISATNTNYVMFIVIIVCFVAPFLFALSSQFLVILEGFIGKMSGANIQQASLSGQLSFFSALFDVESVSIKSEDFSNLALAILSIIGLFSSLIVSTIREGNLKSGLKYIPVFIAISLILFLIINTGLTSVFGSMLV